MVDREEVVAGYRLILGRDPEDDTVVQQHAQAAASVAQLRQTLLSSAEFRANSVIYYEPGTPMPVQVKCSPKEMEAMLHRVQQDWTSKGETEPMWSVLADDRFKSDCFASHSSEFYDSGRSEIERYRLCLTRNGQDQTRLDVCFELGCGVGRATRWLAETHREVIACDISAAHLELAKRYLEKEGVQNVRLLKLDSFSQLHTLRGFDAIFSIIVLQHNPPPVMVHILDALLQHLHRGGIAFFQIPTHWHGYSFGVTDYLKSAACPPGKLEMHALPQQHIFTLAAEHNCVPLEVQRNNSAGLINSVSNTFLLKKMRPRIWPLRRW